MLTILILSCTSPDKIVQDTDTVTDIRPVIIIGGGASGLAAGIRFARIGDFSTYTGKETELGGQDHAGRFFVVDTHWQQHLNIVDSTDVALSEWIDITGAEPDDNIEESINHSAQTLEWIESFNIQFESVLGQDIGAGSIREFTVYPQHLHTHSPCGLKHYCPTL